MLSDLETAMEVSEFTVCDFGEALPAGSQENLRIKFSKRRQREVLAEIVAELSNGKLYLGDWKLGEIQIVGIKRAIQNRFWTEVEYRVLFPPQRGNTPVNGTYRVIRWNSGRMSGVGTLAITTQGDIVVLRSFRHAARRWCLELPRGAIKPEESIVGCARREVLEECGVVPTDASEFHDFGVFDADTGALMADSHIVCITNVEVDENKVNRDVSESLLGPIILKLSKVLEMIAKGEIRDSFLQGALLQARVRGLISF